MLRYSTFFLSIFLLFSCQGSAPPSELFLKLRIHIQGVKSEWIDQGQIKVTLSDTYGQQIHLHHHAYHEESNGLAWELSSSLSGSWSVSLSFNHLLEHQDVLKINPLRLDLLPHPALDRVKQILLYDEYDATKHYVDIHLQPLSFLKSSLEYSSMQGHEAQLKMNHSETWVNTIGLSDQLWWWMIGQPFNEQDDALILSKKEAQIILNQAWRRLSQTSQWASHLFNSQEHFDQLDNMWRPWLLVALLNQDASKALLDETEQDQFTSNEESELPLTWGALLYETLLAELNGQRLSSLSLNILAKVYCSPWSNNSLTKTRCLETFKGIYIESPMELEPLTRQAHLQDSELHSTAEHVSFIYRVISLDGSQLLDTDLFIFDPWGNHLDSDFLELSHDRQDLRLSDVEFSANPRLELEPLAVQTNEFKLAPKALNRPQFEMSLHAMNEAGAQQDKQLLVKYKASLRAQIKGLATIFHPLNTLEAQAEVIRAVPLKENLFIPHYASHWHTDINAEGNFELLIYGYYGPLWLTIDLSNGQKLWLISGMTKDTSVNYLTVVLSPFSTFYTWLSLLFFEKHSSTDEIDNVLVQRIAEIYNYIDEQELWLSSQKTVQDMSDFATRVSRLELERLQAEQLSIMARRYRHGLQCTQSLIDFDLSRVEELSQLWLLGSRPFFEQLQVQEPVYDSFEFNPNTQDWQKHPWLEYSLTIWRSFMIGTCLVQSVLNQEWENQLESDQDLSQKSESAYQRLAINQILKKGSEAGHMFADFGFDLSLNHGVWLYNGESWLISHDENIHLSLKSNRGLVTVHVDGLSTDHDLSTSEPDDSIESFFCPWEWVHNESELWQEHGSRLWDDGQWQMIPSEGIQEFFPLNQNPDSRAIAWRWAIDHELLSPYPLPLTCQLDLSWQSTARELIDEQVFLLKINTELWKLDHDEVNEPEENDTDTEFVNRDLSLELWRSPPALRFRLDSPTHAQEMSQEDHHSGETRGVPWQIYTEASHPHWIFNHAEFAEEREQNSSLKLLLSSTRSVHCESSTQLADLDYAQHIGDYHFPMPLHADQVIRNDQTEYELWQNEISSISTSRPWTRWTREAGGRRFQSEFIGSKQYRLEIGLPRNLDGHKNIFVRCEDALGYSVIKTLSFTVDQQAPRIIEAHLTGINEVLLGGDSPTELDSQLPAHWQRVVDLLTLDLDMPIHWARWLTHWRDCPSQCPDESLNELNLEFKAQDVEWANHELRAKVYADIYVLDDNRNRINQTQLSSSDFSLNDEGFARFNLYTLLEGIDWAQFAPSQGHQFWMEIELVVIDPSEQESKLSFGVTIDAITPMISVQIEPNLRPIHHLITQGELLASLHGNYGRLHLSNPHDIPIKVTINPPRIKLDFELDTREVGLPILSSRLFQSCLYDESFQVSQNQRLVNYQLRADQSIFGDCIPLSQPILDLQTFHYGANEWHQTATDELSLTLAPQSQQTVGLPIFEPELSEILNQVIYAPNVGPNETYPSTYQVKTFTESSIFASMDSFCLNCPTQLLLGHRIVMLNSFAYEPNPSNQALAHYGILNTKYDTALPVQDWSISVSFTNDQTQGALFPLFLTQMASVRFD